MPQPLIFKAKRLRVEFPAVFYLSINLNYKAISYIFLTSSSVKETMSPTLIEPQVVPVNSCIEVVVLGLKYLMVKLWVSNEVYC